MSPCSYKSPTIEDAEGLKKPLPKHIKANPINLYGKIVNSKQSTIHSSKVEEYSVKEYRLHHDDIEEKLNDLKNLLIKYLPQKNDQQIRRKLLFSLFEVEYDLNIHSQIEDTILIPLVEKMEKHLKRSK